MTVSAAAWAVVGGGVVNGPEDRLPEWTAIEWREAAEDVRRLRQRIFMASKVGDLAK
jgi:RNA-directed DNA polymerase